MLGSEGYLITAVGGSVEKNTKAIGHTTLRADGATELEAPGTVSVERKPLVGVVPGDPDPHPPVTRHQPSASLAINSTDIRYDETRSFLSGE